MTPADYFIALRRRWADLVLAVVVAVTAAWFITAVAPPGPPVREWRATSVLLSTGTSFGSGALNMKAVASLATVGEVPRIAAEELGRDDAYALAQQVRAVGDSETGFVRLTASSPDRAESARVADAFGSALVSFLRDQRAATTFEDARALTKRLDELEAEIDRLDRAVARAPAAEADLLRAERDAQVRQYGLLYESYQQLANAVTRETGVEVIQRAVPRPASTGFQVPQSRTSRLIIAAILGLIGGIVIVLVIDRFDTRLRTRKATEKAFGLPVLAEIPFVPRRRRRALSVTGDGPLRSRHADAFRLLALMLTMPPASETGEGNGRSRKSGPRTVLFTSAGPADGKSTIVANVAAALAERGQRVVILSCDFRRPRVHRLLGVENKNGLVQAIEAGDADLIQPRAYETVLPNVFLVPSGNTPERPMEVLGSSRMEKAIAEAKELVDVVLIDTPPILTTSDATALFDKVDAVLMVARAGRTTVEVAERASEVIARLGAPAIGVALNAATEIAEPRRYYYYSYGLPSDRGFSRLLRPSRKARV